ncbi:MAG: hypothetical protein U0169_09045 [Polyangiaceae bacterium]
MPNVAVARPASRLRALPFRGLACVASFAVALTAVGCASSSGDDVDVADDSDEGASAIVTRRCPATLVAKFLAPSIAPLAEVELLAGTPFTDERRDEIRVQGERLGRLARYEIDLSLQRAERSECFYEANSPMNGPKTSARFFSRDGRNVLRVDARDGAVADFSFYVNVDSYAKAGWALEDDAFARVALRTGDVTLDDVPSPDGGVSRPVVIGRMASLSLAPELF